MKLQEDLLTTQRLFTGKILNLDIEQVQLPNGEKAQREIVHHHGAIAIMAFVEHKLLVVEQWREPMRQITLEIPAGKVEPGVKDLQAEALRELNEETGYYSNDLIKVSGFYSSPGFTDEYLTLYYAPHLKKVEHKRPLDKDEFLNIHTLTWQQTQAQIKAGLICDAKTIMAVTLWQNFLLRAESHE